jgi:phenylacetate 2-hydroxylase
MFSLYVGENCWYRAGKSDPRRKGFRDYVPILRFLIPDAVSGNVVVTAEKIRQQHLDVLYASLKKRIAEGEEVSCVITGLVKDKLSEEEQHGTCKALLQAAPDSTASSV